MRAYTPAAIKSFVQSFDHLPFIQDADEVCKSVQPLRGAAPIPFSSRVRRWYCELCEENTDYYICRSRTDIKDHRRKIHGETLCRLGRNT